MCLQAAQQLDGADAASPAFGFRAILALGWPGGSSRGRWAANHLAINSAMKLRTTIVIGFAVSLLARGTLAQSTTVTSNPVGVWRGRSTCLVRPSACNDEIVVYRLTRVNASDSLAVDARKIVNGQEVDMGVVSCRATPTGAQLTCIMPGGVWRFTIRGDSLVGELTLSDSTKYRDVRTARSR
jgi:hypothetical protein